MAPSTFSTQALCLLLVVIMACAAHVGAASAAGKPLPGSCLTAASTLCANADTNAMRCLTKLAIAGDARVPAACAEAILADVTMNPRRNQASRTQRLTRMLTEGGNCDATLGGNSCPNSFAGGINACNDVLDGCGGCPQGTYTITASAPNPGLFIVIGQPTSNPRVIACSNICCAVANGNGACCNSWTGGGNSGVICLGSSHASCNPNA